MNLPSTFEIVILKFDQLTGRHLGNSLHLMDGEKSEVKISQSFEKKLENEKKKHEYILYHNNWYNRFYHNSKTNNHLHL